MRIVVLTNLYPNPYHLQRGTFNRQQLKGLADDHPLHVISPLAWTDELIALSKQGRRLSPQRRTVCDGIHVDHPRYCFPPKFMRDWYGHFLAASIRRTFDRVATEFQPDVVFAPWAYPDGWAAVKLGHARGVPVVVKVHGSDVLLLDRYKGRRRRTIEALRAADGIIAVSEDLRRSMIELGVRPSKIDVVYDGVDRSRFFPGCRQQARQRLGLSNVSPIVLFVGNLLPVKGLDVLINAAARLVRTHPTLNFYLIGEGPLRHGLEQTIARLGLVERVNLLGGRPHEELPDWYRAADLFVLPSRSEGVPCVLLESAACGTPFVASRVGGVPEIAHLVDNRLVPPNDPAALVAATEQMLSTINGTGNAIVGQVRDMKSAVREIEACLQRVLSISPRNGCPQLSDSVANVFAAPPARNEA